MALKDEEDESFPSQKEILQDDIAWDGSVYRNTLTNEKLCSMCYDYVVASKRVPHSNLEKLAASEFCECAGCGIFIGSE